MSRENDAAESLANEGNPEADRHLAENFGMTVRQVREFDPQTLDSTRACKFLGLPLKRFDQLASQPEARAKWVESVAREKKDLIELFPQASKELKEMLEAIRKFALRKCLKPDGPALVDGGGPARSKARSVDKGISTQNLVIGGGVLVAVVLVGGIVAVMMTARGGPEKQASLPKGGDPERAGQVDSQATKPAAVDKDSGEFPKAVGNAGGEREQWTPLFNGKDLTGWTSYGKPTWAWVDGQLVGTPTQDKSPGFLMTDASYTDFEIELEYKASIGIGSGLFLRGVSDGPISGAEQLEIQIIDDSFPAWQNGRYKTGSVFAAFARKAEPKIATGAWNAMRVKLYSRKIEVWVNGTQTVDASLDDARSQFGKFPGLARVSGRIGLQQNHNADVQFRNVRVKKIAPDTPKPEQPRSASSFNVKSVWKGDQRVLTVTERKDDKFTANFKIGTKIERIVTGTIEDDKIRWLGKDVRAIIGETKGGNYNGTFSRDSDGDSIEFAWLDGKGESGSFVLRLSTEPVVKPVPTPPRLEDIIGAWDSDFGKVTLETNKSGVVSGYWIQGSNKKGFISSGTFTPSTRTLTFSITQPWNNEKGSATFTLSADGTKLDGAWKHSSGSGKWQMTRVAR